MGKEETKYQKIIKLYKEGKTNKEIAELVHTTEATISTSISKARREGKIEENENSKFQQFLKMVESGITDKKILRVELGLAETTANAYMTSARARLAINKEQGENTIDTTQSRRKILSESYKGITALKRTQIKKLLTTMLYPIDIAKVIGVEPYNVYNVIDNMTEKEKIEITRDALVEIESTEKLVQNLFELADAYYILGSRNACQRVVTKIKNRTKAESTKEYATTILGKYKMDFLARDIRKEYRKSKENGNEPMNYETICKKHNVRISFVEQILGKEDRDIV